MLRVRLGPVTGWLQPTAITCAASEPTCVLPNKHNWGPITFSKCCLTFTVCWCFARLCKRVCTNNHLAWNTT